FMTGRVGQCVTGSLCQTVESCNAGRPEPRGATKHDAAFRYSGDRVLSGVRSRSGAADPGLLRQWWRRIADADTDEKHLALARHERLFRSRPTSRPGYATQRWLRPGQWLALRTGGHVRAQ